MSSRLLDWIDRWCAQSLCVIIFQISRGLGALRDRRPSVAAPVAAICLSKLAGLGSIINTVPLLRSIRARYPRARIVYVTFARHQELVQRLNLVDEALFIDDRSLASLLGSFWAVAKRLRQLDITLYLDLQYYTICYLPLLMAMISSASQTVGFYRHATRMKKRALDRAVYFNGTQPLPAGFGELGAAIDCELCDAPASECPLTTRAQDWEEVARHLGPWRKATTRLLVINPNASRACLERRWPREDFADTASALLRQLPELRVVLVGSAQERGYVESVRRAIGEEHERVLDLAGVLSLGALLALLKEAHCLLTNDTGPMHLGFACGTPTVALFGPGNPRDHVAQADPNKTIIFYEAIYCSPCIHFISPPPCGGHNVCMRRIPAAAVRNACLTFLKADESRGAARQIDRSSGGNRAA